MCPEKKNFLAKSVYKWAKHEFATAMSLSRKDNPSSGKGFKRNGEKFYKGDNSKP